MLFIYNKIERLRKEKGLSKMDFYKAVGMTDTGFRQAKENNSLKVVTLIKIAEVLDVAPEYLLYQTDEDLILYKVLEATFTAAKNEGEKLLNEIKALEKSRDEWREKYYGLLDMKITMVMPDNEQAKKTPHVSAAGSEHELNIAAEPEIEITKTKK